MKTEDKEMIFKALCELIPYEVEFIHNDELHIDRWGLIEKGMAIDKRTIK